jgi:hypothetical protein
MAIELVVLDIRQENENFKTFAPDSESGNEKDN